MPRRDKSGPMGQGSQTGRGMGSCSDPSTTNGRSSGRGAGMGAGRGSRMGSGRGSGRGSGMNSGRGAGQGSGRGLGSQNGNNQRAGGFSSSLWRFGQSLGAFFARLSWQLGPRNDLEEYKDKTQALEEDKRALEYKIQELEKRRDKNKLNQNN